LGPGKPETFEWQINVERIDTEIFINACKTTSVISAELAVSHLIIMFFIFILKEPKIRQSPSKKQYLKRKHSFLVKVIQQ
jgi:hypothetical protein